MCSFPMLFNRKTKSDTLANLGCNVFLHQSVVALPSEYFNRRHVLRVHKPTVDKGDVQEIEDREARGEFKIQGTAKLEIHIKPSH
jgi:hypothetical protein